MRTAASQIRLLFRRKTLIATALPETKKAERSMRIKFQGPKGAFFVGCLVYPACREEFVAIVVRRFLTRGKAFGGKNDFSRTLMAPLFLDGRVPIGPLQAA